jgi:tetratricopeptide (TPR) repeat protein
MQVPPDLARDEEGAARAVTQALLAPRSSSPETLAMCSQVLGTLSDETYGPRVAEWSDFPARVTDRAQSPDGRAELKAELSEDGPAWERAQIALTLARYEADLDEWIRLYKLATECLQDRHYVELRDLGLRAELAKANCSSGRLSQALTDAEEAVERDPLDVYERIVLAAVYQAIGELDMAIENYQHCLAIPTSRADEEALIHLNMGYVYFLKAQDARTLEQRHDLAHRAAAAYRDAFLMQSDRPVAETAAAHRSLGIAYFILGESEAALAQLRIAQLREPEWPRTICRLARVYMMQGAHAAAEAELEPAIDKLAAQLAADGPAEPPGPASDPDPEDEPGDPALLLASMRLDLAASYLMRGAALDRVGTLVEEARVTSDELDPAFSRELKARVFGTRGWMYLERYKQSGVPELLELALTNLEQALCLDALAQVYLLLGFVLERKARGDERDRDALLARAGEALQRAQGLDPWGEFSALSGELQSLLQTPTSASNGRVGAVSALAPAPG